MKLNQFAVYRVDQQTAGKALWHAKQVDPVLEDLYLFYFREGE